MLHQALKTEYLLIRIGDYRNVSIADNAAEFSVAVAGGLTRVQLVAAVHFKADLVAIFNKVYLPAVFRAVEVEGTSAILLHIAKIQRNYVHLAAVVEAYSAAITAGNYLVYPGFVGDFAVFSAHFSHIIPPCAPAKATLYSCRPEIPFR